MRILLVEVVHCRMYRFQSEYYMNICKMIILIEKNILYLQKIFGQMFRTYPENRRKSKIVNIFVIRIKI